MSSKVTGFVYLGLPLLFWSAFAHSADYRYTVKFAQPAPNQGAVIVDRIKWNCKGDICRVIGPWPSPGIDACSALAAKQGLIIEYGHTGNKLDKEGLKLCNHGVTNKAVSKININKSVINSNKTPPENRTANSNVTLQHQSKSPSPMLELDKKIGVAKFLSLKEKLNIAGIKMGNGVGKAIRIDLQHPYNGLYDAGFSGENINFDSRSNVYIVRSRKRNINDNDVYPFLYVWWRAEANKIYTLDCSVANAYNLRNYDVGLGQIVPRNRNRENDQLRFRGNVSNVTAVAGPFTQAGMVMYNLYALPVRDSDDGVNVAIALKGCEIQAVN